MEKELANWIYYEEGGEYYCHKCIEDRLEQINENKEFSNFIDYKNGDECGYMKDYAREDHEVYCCKCGVELHSLIDT